MGKKVEGKQEGLFTGARSKQGRCFLWLDVMDLENKRLVSLSPKEEEQRVVGFQWWRRYGAWALLMEERKARKKKSYN